MKRQTMIAAAAAALGLAALLAWAFAPRPPEVETAAVTRGHFESSIDEDAKTRLRDRYVVSAPLAGRLERLVLREGDTVAAGAVVATLSAALPPLLDERTRRELELRVAAAQANVQRADARIGRARVGQEQALHDQLRSEELASSGFISKTKLDSDRLAVLAARQELATAVEERHVAGHEAEQARVALQSVTRPDAASGHRAFEVRSPIAGRVVRVLQASEAVVALGAPLVELGDMSRLEVVAELLTSDAVQARPGARVRIHGWGGEGELEGLVRRVEPGAFTKVSALGVEEQRVRVVIDLVSPPERWRALGDGFRVGVRIVARAADDVNKAPASAVFPLPQGGMGSFVVDEGRAHLVPVVVEARNGHEVWLREGPKPGAAVVVYPASAISDGVRVKLRRVEAGS